RAPPIFSLSLHDALPILICLSSAGQRLWGRMRRIDGGTLLILNDRAPQRPAPRDLLETLRRHAATLVPMLGALEGPIPPALAQRSEEHTSELQSRENLVC